MPLIQTPIPIPLAPTAGIPRISRAAVVGLLFLLSAPLALAGETDSSAESVGGAPTAIAEAGPIDPAGGTLETQRIPELGQTIVYGRFPDAIEGAATLEYLDSQGEVRATSGLDVTAGTGMTIWDGRDAGGDLLPSDLYVVRLRLDGRELTAPLVR